MKRYREFEGRKIPFRSLIDKEHLGILIQAANIHKRLGNWRAVGGELCIEDVMKLRRQVKARLGYSQGREKIPSELILDCVNRHLAGEDADDLANEYHLNKVTIFQRARVDYGYLVGSRKFKVIPEDVEAERWGKILYSPILSYREVV